MRLQQCKLIELPKFSDPRGNLTFVEGGNHIPFAIQRIFYLYDVPGGASRAAHAHKTSHQLLVAMSGSFDVTLSDGTSQIKFNLNRPYLGLYIPSMTWRDIDNFSSGAVCLALASTKYNESDYIRDYNVFLQTVRDEQATQ